jgi:flagellar protein FlaG
MSSNINTIQVPVDNSFVLKSVVEQEKVLKQKLDTIADKEIKAESKPSENSNLNRAMESITEGEELKNSIESSKTSEIIEKEVEEALEIISSFINNTVKQVTFSHDDDAGKMVITMVDKETQEVINQFPSEKIISMAGRIKDLYQEVESISGLIIDSHV